MSSEIFQDKYICVKSKWVDNLILEINIKAQEGFKLINVLKSKNIDDIIIYNAIMERIEEITISGAIK